MDQLQIKMKSQYEYYKNEYQIVRRKLDTKCEALQIIARDLDQIRQERDQFKLMAEQVQERHQALKRQLSPGYSLNQEVGECDLASQTTSNLARLLIEVRENSKILHFENEDLKSKLNDAQGDIKLLREQIARQRVGTSDEGLNSPRLFPAHEREELVEKLEAAKEEYEQLERDIKQVFDEKEELVTERDVYKSKYERLNTELHHILKGDEKRIVDIDALVMENKYLKDRLKQTEEENNILKATVSKYKSILEKKKNKGILKMGQSRTGGVVISQKQVSQLLNDKDQMTLSPQMMKDLQGLAGALLETVHDKNLALQHQRKTNKILGSRVSELEKKLRTLEVSGLWSLPGTNLTSPTLDKLRAECEEIKMLVPKPSHSSDDNYSNVCTPNISPLHKPNSANRNGGISLEDLDLLPTKEETYKDQEMFLKCGEDYPGEEEIMDLQEIKL